MPVTPQQIEQAYSMFAELKVQPSGDFKVDAETALVNFVGIYNRNKGDNDPALRFSGEYTEEFGQQVVEAADRMQARLEEGLGALGNPLTRMFAVGDMKKAFEGESFPAGVDTLEEKAQHRIKQLEVSGIIKTLDQAASEGWAVEGQTVENTPQNSSNTTEQKPVETKFDIEAYKAKIGDTTPEGQLAENFGELEYAHLDRTLNNAQKVVKYLGLEKEMPPFPEKGSPEAGAQMEAYLVGFTSLEDKITTGLQEKLDDVEWYDDAWSWIKRARGPMPGVGLSETGKVERQQGIAKQTLIDIKEAVAAADMTATEQSAVVNGQEVVNGSVVQNGLENQTPGKPGVELSDIEQASLDVETVLQDTIIPLLKENGVQNVSLSGAPDGTFDESSQKVLQTFLFAADAKLGDLGDKPWLYTEELGSKLGENLKSYIKSDPAAFARMYNAQLAELGEEAILGVNKDGKLVYARDIEQSGVKQGQIVADEDKGALSPGIDKSIDGFILNLNILNGQNAEKKKVLSDEQLVDQMAMMPPQMKLIGFLIGMLAPFIPESWMNGISNFCQEMFGFDLKSLIPQDAETGDFSIGKAFGVTGDKAVDNDKLSKLYKEALADVKGDTKLLRSRVTDGIKSMFAEANDPKTEQIYMAAAEKAFEKSEEILTSNPDDPEYATDVFVGEFYKGVNAAEKHREGNRIREAGFVDYDDNKGFLMPENKQDQTTDEIGEKIVYEEVEKWDPNGEESRRDYLVRLRDEQRTLNRERYNLGIRPNFERGEDGRVYMEYYDRKTVNNISYYEGTFKNGRQVQPGHIKNLENALKNYEEEVQSYERQIAHLKGDLKKDLGEYAEDKNKQIADLEKKMHRYIKENKGRVEHIREDIVKGKEELAALKGSQYKRVDVTDELARLDDIAAEGNWQGVYHTQFPGLSKAVHNYGGWGDMQKIHGLVQKSDFRTNSRTEPTLTKRQQSFKDAEAKSATKFYFNKASNLVDDWNDLEDERRALQEQHEKLEADGVATDSKEYKSWARKWDKLERKLDKLDDRYKEKIQTNQRGVGLTDSEGKRIAFRVNKDAFMDPDKIMKDTDYGVSAPGIDPVQTQGQ